MLSKHPILSLGTFSRPLRCHGKSDKVYVTKNGEKTQCVGVKVPWAQPPDPFS